MKRIFFLLVCVLIISATSGQTQLWQSKMVPIVDGRLTYMSDENNNRIPNYSHAGYMGGGVEIPQVEVKITLNPGDGDRTADIQAAIDQVAAMTMNENGFRGAVLLEPGRYLIEGTINLDQSGIVLKGSGDGHNPVYNTIIYRDNPNNGENVFRIGGDISWDSGKNKLAGSETNISTDFVQAGSYSFDVADAGNYIIGDHIIIYHPDSEAWLAAVEHGNTGTHADAEPWKSGEVEVKFDRYITNIEGNIITLDVPVFMHLDKSISQSYIYKFDDNSNNIARNIGLESIRVEIATNGPFSEDHCQDIIKGEAGENFWIGNITASNFVRSLFSCNRLTRSTIFNCKALEPHSVITGSRRYNFFLADATQLVLVKNCFSTEGRHDMTCGGSGRFAAANSGNVFHNVTVLNTNADSDNHVRWYQGILHNNNQWIDPATHENVLSFGNRGHWSGQAGYTSVFCTAWNCKTNDNKMNLQGVPTGENYSIGCHADDIDNTPLRSFFGVAPDGYIEGKNKEGIFPQSLYLAQLRQRLDTSHLLYIDSPAIINTSGINIFNGEQIISIGDSIELIASVLPVDASNKVVSWESNDTQIATIDNGIVKGINEGSVYIRAITSDGSFTDSTEIGVTSDVFVSGITLNPSILLIDVGETDSLSLIFEPENATNKNVTWSSDNNSVVSVSNGYIEALSAGSATITAITEEGAYSATSFIMVNEPTTGFNNKKTESFKCYPNPANHHLIIECIHEMHVELLNTMGQVLYSYNLDKGKNTINLSLLSEGNYILKTDNGSVLKIQKNE